MSELMEGVVHLCVDIRVTPKEMAHWPEGCIREFFTGISQAMRAKSAADELLHQQKQMQGKRP